MRQPFSPISKSAAEKSRLRRREFLKLAPVALIAAFAIPRVQRAALPFASDLTGRALGGLHRDAALAPTFAVTDLTPIEHFPVNSYLTDDPGTQAAGWKLIVEGAVESPGEYSLAQIQALPRRTQITRHICIEGWSVIGSFGGVRLADFLLVVGAAPGARFVEVECADDYYESIDMATALHPQTLLCDEMYGQTLTAAHGAPLRLQIPTKLGYKQAKYLATLRVSRVLGARRGYWVDQGYPWYGGL
jgi:DMSO/TMAO reductase YedYZ molybdopterin-dependent catalytic subunit